MDLLAAKRDQQVAAIVWIEKRIEVLSGRVNQARQREADSAKAEVAQMQQDTVGSDPLLITDRYRYTLQALALTLVTAAPLSLLLTAAGWQLQTAGPDNPLDHAVGHTQFRVAMHLYILRALRMICIPRRLAAAYFRWPESSLRVLRVELDRLTWVFVPAFLVLRLAAAT